MENNEVFVDSNVLIGLFNEDDALHKKTVQLWYSLKEQKARIVISNFVVSEVITILSQRVSKQSALQFAFSVYGNKREEVEVVRMDEQEELLALDYLKRIPLKNISFVDTTIFAILKLRSIKKLASFDHIFKNRKGIELITI